jgi:uncharacterized protein (DUF1015 family)
VAVIEPFHGLRYGSRLADSIAEVIAPPYDVISAELQDELHDRHPANFIRLEYGRADNGTDRYTQARSTLDTWSRNGSLIQEQDPAYYLYEQSFTLPAGVDVATSKAIYRRRAVFASVTLEPYGQSIFPHERTLAGPKADRLKLIEATEANLSPVFAIVSDEQKAMDGVVADVATRSPLLYEGEDGDGQTHRLWRADGPLAKELAAVVDGSSLTIADGHHRYETALAYRDHVRGANGASPSPTPADAVMMALVSSHSDELVILPTFRLLSGLPAEVVESLPRRLTEAGCEVVELGAADGDQAVTRMLDAVRSSTSTTFGLCLPHGRLVTVSPDGADVVGDSADLLDVAYLHQRLLPDFLGVNTDDAAGQERVRYTANRDGALGAVRAGKAQVAVFVRGVTMAEVEHVAMSGGVMPQKSTYFYPKMPSGLVARRLT